MPVTINILKAEEITKEKIRIWRKPQLDALDVEFTRALEDNASTASIVAQKKSLRDKTNETAGKTVEQLKVLIDSLNPEV